MLTLPRAAVRQYCQVLRKAGLTKRGRTEATIRIQADRGGLMFQAANDQLAVAYAIAGTFDLNGSIVIRARQGAEFPATELVLRRSQREGSEIRLVTDRRFLKRALDLGFTDIGFTSPNGPQGRRIKIWT